jgi:hypothetical protein
MYGSRKSTAWNFPNLLPARKRKTSQRGPSAFWLATLLCRRSSPARSVPLLFKPDALSRISLMLLVAIFSAIILLLCFLCYSGEGNR